MSTTTEAAAEKAAAADTLRDAARRLTEPAVQAVKTSSGVQEHRSPSALEQLNLIHAAGPGARRGGASGSSAGSRPPMFMPAFELIEEIRGTANREAVRLSGVARYCFDLTDAVNAWVKAALADGAEAMKAAARTIMRWVNTIATMTEPPVFQELDAACPECNAKATITTDVDGGRRIGPAMIIEVRDAGSVISCRACKSAWLPGQTVDLGAWVHGLTKAELLARMEADAAPAAPVKPRPDQGQVLAELQDYVAAEGHLPPNGSGTDQELRLSKWVRNKMNAKPSSEQAIILRDAVVRIVEANPSASEAAKRRTGVAA